MTVGNARKGMNHSSEVNPELVACKANQAARNAINTLVALVQECDPLELISRVCLLYTSPSPRD